MAGELKEKKGKKNGGEADEKTFWFKYRSYFVGIVAGFIYGLFEIWRNQ